MKHSKIVVFLSLLLVAIMAFSSCSGSAVIPEDDAQLNNAPKEDIIIDLLDDTKPAGSDDALKSEIAANKTEIANAVAKWHEYVGFKQNSLVADETAIANDILNNYTRVTFDRNGALITVRAEQDVWDATAGETGAYVLSHKRVLVYNLYKENFEEPVFDSDDYKDSDCAQTFEANYTKYSISTNPSISGFKVLKTDYIAKYESSQDNPETQVFKEYEVKYSTTFYTTEAIEPTVEENMNWSTSYVSGYYNVTIGDKVYAINSKGEILKTFDKGLEYVLPANPDYEQDGLKYYYEDEYVYVLDKDFAPVSSYSYLTDYDFSRWVLPNGNIFLQYKKQLDDNAEVYDYETAGGDKYDVVQHIYNVKTGAVQELELGYIIKNFYDSDNGSFAIKNEENFVVNVYKYTKGGIYSEIANSAMLVLKGDLELVAELPEIIENQSGMPQFVAMNKLIVSTKFAGVSRNYNVLVSADGSYELLPYGVSFGKTTFSYDGETCIYKTGSDNEYVTPFENYTVLTTFNGGTTRLLKAKNSNSNYVEFYYYSESEGSYVTKEVYAKDVEKIVGSLILLDNGNGQYVWYDAAGNYVVSTESTSYTSVADGILIHVYHASSSHPTRYYFVK